VLFFNSRNPNLSITSSFSSIWSSFISMNYITCSPSQQHKHCLASFYVSSWDFKIFYVQSRVLKVCANAYNIKVLPISIWKSTIPEICWLTKSTYKNWALCPLHHASGLLSSSSVTFLTMVLSQLLIPFSH
jgi:hypothetical protein